LPSIIKVDQIQSDTGNVAFTGNIAFPAGSASSPSITAAGDTNTGIVFPAADTIAFTEGGVEGMRITSAGDVGIGTASPSGLGGKVLQIDSASNYPELIFNRTGSGARKWGALIGNDGDYLIRDYTSSLNQFFIDTSGNLRFNSGYGSAATAYGCRAWVNFNAVGTASIRASGNVSSITDNGDADFIINFTNAFPDTNYTFCGAVRESGTTGNISNRIVFPDQGSFTTSSYRVHTTNQSLTRTNDPFTMCMFFR
jgi:hypothetical protein